MINIHNGCESHIDGTQLQPQKLFTIHYSLFTDITGWDWDTLCG